MISKKTKIVATIGPATEDNKVLERLFKAGVNVTRLNFSHGDHAEHQLRVDSIRKISKKMGKPIAILQDLSGPKIRIGEFYQEKVELKAGEEFVLTTKECIGDEHKAYVNYSKLPQEVKKGGIIFLDDGKKKLEIKSIKGDEIHCEIIIGGITKGRRGVNVPGAYLSLSSLTDKDRKDLQFGIKNDVEYMAISFVRRAEDVLELRRILNKSEKAKDTKIIAKIETEEAIENIDEILKVTDGVMVARGDLAVEVPAEDVPVYQKEIIKKCNELGLPVITATQMLESMIHSPVPTRAEVNDVANAIFDGTDAVMLSEETTLGEYPVHAVEMMKRIASRVEKEIEHAAIIQNSLHKRKSITDSFSYAAINRAHEIDAAAIVALSKTGQTGRMVSRYRPHKPLIVMTPSEKVYRQLALSYGCYSILTPQFTSLASVLAKSQKLLLQQEVVKKGDVVVIVAGIPFGHSGGTNLLFAQTI